MKGVQCYELFGGIALKIHTFSFSFSYLRQSVVDYVCISNLSMNINYYSELRPCKLN